MRLITIQFIFYSLWSVVIKNGTFAIRIEELPTRDDAEASVMDLLLDMNQFGYTYGCCAVMPDVIDCMPDDAVIGSVKEWDVI